MAAVGLSGWSLWGKERRSDSEPETQPRSAASGTGAMRPDMGRGGKPPATEAKGEGMPTERRAQPEAEAAGGAGRSEAKGQPPPQLIEGASEAVDRSGAITRRFGMGGWTL